MKKIGVIFSALAVSMFLSSSAFSEEDKNITQDPTPSSKAPLSPKQIQQMEEKVKRGPHPLKNSIIERSPPKDNSRGDIVFIPVAGTPGRYKITQIKSGGSYDGVHWTNSQTGVSKVLKVDDQLTLEELPNPKSKQH